jgi:hypothetical protein
VRFAALLKMARERETGCVSWPAPLFLGYSTDGGAAANRRRAQDEGAQLWPGGVQPRLILKNRRELETGARGALREDLFKTRVRGPGIRCRPPFSPVQRSS